MLDLPTLDAISTVPADDLPALIGRLEVLKVQALLRLLAAREQPVAGEPSHDLTQQEAATYRPAFGLKLIRFLTRTGRVPSTGRGRQRLVRLADLDAYAARCRADGVALGGILNVSSPHDRRRGATHPTASGTDATPVRRARRGVAQHRRPLGAGRTDGRDDGRHPDPTPGRTGADPAPERQEAE